MRIGESGSASGRLRLGITKFFPTPKPGKRNECEQVAAICYRIRCNGIEFLLIRTRSGRWTFPKGGIEPGLTHAQAAALEAFEEAGVHGRMEEASFARYVQRKRGHMRRATELAVSAHLCEVLRLVPPPELNRNPTWFSAEKAKRRLRDDRAPDYGADLSRVIDKAINRIQRLRSGLGTAPEAPSSTQPAGTQRKDAGQKARLIQIDCARGTTGRTKAASAG